MRCLPTDTNFFQLFTITGVATAICLDGGVRPARCRRFCVGQSTKPQQKDPSGTSYYDEAPVHLGRCGRGMWERVSSMQSCLGVTSENLNDDDMKHIFAYLRNLKPIRQSCRQHQATDLLQSLWPEAWQRRDQLDGMSSPLNPSLWKVRKFRQ